MNPATQKILEEALRLPDGERAALIGCLIDSLEVDGDDDSQSAWDVEIQHRLAELDSKSVTPISWSDARRMILQNSDGTSST